MIRATFPPYNDGIEDFKITPEIDKKLEAFKVVDVTWVDDVSKAPKRQNSLGIGELFETSISKVLNNVRQLLLDKNRKYGNSALDPKRIFSKSNAVEQIKVRIDDKLSRLMSGQLDDTEDVELDLLGYLVLLQVAKNREVK